jgi:hypothetical protein
MRFNAKLESVRQFFDLEGWARMRGAATQNKAGELLMQCPNCQRPKLCVNTDKQSWHCWYCQTKPTIKGYGGLVSLVALVDNLSEAKAFDFIVKEAREPPICDLDELQRLAKRLGALQTPVFAWAFPIEWPSYCRKIQKDDPEVWPFLEHRGITEDQVMHFDLRYCYAGRYRHRVIFPVYERGHFVYFQARATWRPEEQQEGTYFKSLNPSSRDLQGVGKKDLVMNLDSARRFERVVIVEGPVDCVHAGPEAVCTFGNTIHALQIQKMLRQGVQKVDLMWDGPDEKNPRGAWDAMEKAAPQLKAYFKEVRLVYLPWGDPGSMSREEILAFRQTARPYRS